MSDKPGPKTFQTYSRVDGELVGGEYGWVTDLESMEYEVEDSDYLEVLEETWQRVGYRVLKLGRLERWCQECDEDVTLTVPVDGPVWCDGCRELGKDKEETADAGSEAGSPV